MIMLNITFKKMITVTDKRICDISDNGKNIFIIIHNNRINNYSNNNKR